MALTDALRATLAALFGRPLAPAPSPSPARAEAHEVAREPSARTWIEWTPSLVQAAEIQCAAGSLRLAADCCHALLGDDRVGATLGVRTRGLMGLPVTFEPGGSKRRAARVLRSIEADEDWWAMVDEATLAEWLQWAVLLGVGFAKLVPVRAPSGREVLRAEVWDPRWFRYDWTLRTWLVTTDAGTELPLAADGRWLILTPYGAHAPWTHGLWRALARWWLLKHYARSDWARHGEVKASGVLVGSYTSPGTQDLSPVQRRQLAAQFVGLGRDAAVVLPRGVDLKLVESTAKNFETFQAQVTAADTAIAVAVLGQNLTTEVKGGSYAAAQVHQQVADYLRRADAECLATTLHDQLLTFWAAHNFGDSSVAPWPRWKVDPDTDVSALGVAYKALGEGLAALDRQAPEGQRIDRAAVFLRANVPLEDRPAPPPGPVVTPPLTPPPAPPQDPPDA